MQLRLFPTLTQLTPKPQEPKIDLSFFAIFILSASSKDSRAIGNLFALVANEVRKLAEKPNRNHCRAIVLPSQTMRAEIALLRFLAKVWKYDSLVLHYSSAPANRRAAPPSPRLLRLPSVSCYGPAK